MQIQSFDLFPTLVMCFDLSNHPATERVLSLMKTSTKVNHVLVENGSSTYDSNTMSKFLSNPILTDFRTSIEECIKDYCTVTGIKTTKITNSWINEMGKGGKVIQHRHEMSAISGAYYPIWDNENANLIFKNPMQIYKMAELHQTETFYNANEIEIQGKQGQLILFPSYLEHYTKENQSTQRFVMSFNSVC